MDLSAYKDLYISTAKEYLEKIEKNVEQLKINPSDVENISGFHLNIHSLASQSYAMGYSTTALLCKVLENYFHQIKEGEKKLTIDQLPIISGSIQNIEDSINIIMQNSVEPDLNSKITDLKSKLSIE